MLNPRDYKIMIIDDDQASAESMHQHFRACGFRVAALKTATMVLKKVLSEAPSIILIDLMSPQRAGLKICRELHGNQATQHIPLIMVTAKVDEMDQIVALELGVDDFVHKPCNLHELNLRIERSLDRAAAHAGLASN